jgi:hypothetical protein
LECLRRVRSGCDACHCSGRFDRLCKHGYIDVQALTCAQLANTYQEDADYLTVWYSGWYNGLGKKHMMLVDRAKTIEHRVIVYCKANPDKKVIQAIDVVIKAYRAEKGIKVDE